METLHLIYLVVTDEEVTGCTGVEEVSLEITSDSEFWEEDRYRR